MTAGKYFNFGGVSTIDPIDTLFESQVRFLVAGEERIFKLSPFPRQGRGEGGAKPG